MVFQTKQLATSVACVYGLLVIAGCGGDSGRISTYPVTGTVTGNGKPIVGAQITFHPEDEEGTRPAFGVTNQDGEFSLTTYDDGDGAIAGQYTVSIEKQAIRKEIDVENLTPGGPQQVGGGDMYAKMMVGNRTEKSTVKSDDIPQKFRSPETSGLKRTVEPSGGNEFNFKVDKGGS